MSLISGTKERLAADVNKYKTLLAKTRSHEESKDLAFKLSLAEAKLKALNQKQAAPLGDDHDEAIEVGYMGELSDLEPTFPR